MASARDEQHAEREARPRASRWILLILLLAALSAASVFAWQYHRMRTAVRMVESHGRKVEYRLRIPQVKFVETLVDGPVPWVHDVVRVDLGWRPLGGGELQRVVQALQGFDDLRTLGLAGTGLTDADLPELLAFRDLEVLQLDQTEITDAGIKTIAQLQQLRQLSLAGTGITDAGLASLSGLSNLEVLLLDDTQIGDEGILALAALPKLRDVSLSNTNATERGLGALARQRAAIVVTDD